MALGGANINLVFNNKVSHRYSDRHEQHQPKCQNSSTSQNLHEISSHSSSFRYHSKGTRFTKRSNFGIDNDTVKYLFNHLLFSVGPNPNRLIPFMDGLADQMGWTVVGLVIQGSENDTSFEEKPGKNNFQNTPHFM